MIRMELLEADDGERITVIHVGENSWCTGATKFTLLVDESGEEIVERGEE